MFRKSIAMTLIGCAVVALAGANANAAVRHHKAAELHAASARTAPAPTPYRMPYKGY